MTRTSTARRPEGEAAGSAERVPWARLKWAGGTHRFLVMSAALPGDRDHAVAGHKLAPVVQLHDREHTILGRLIGGGWSALDITRTIGAGLWGGGDVRAKLEPLTDPMERLRLRHLSRDLDVARQAEADLEAIDALIDRKVLARPLGQSLPLAQLIMLARLTGLSPDVADQGLSVDEAFAAGLMAAAGGLDV